MLRMFWNKRICKKIWDIFKGYPLKTSFPRYFLKMYFSFLTKFFYFWPAEVFSSSHDMWNLLFEYSGIMKPKHVAWINIKLYSWNRRSCFFGWCVLCIFPLQKSTLCNVLVSNTFAPREICRVICIIVSEKKYSPFHNSYYYSAYIYTE